MFCFIIVIPTSAVQPWCGSQNLYFQNNASISPAGYEELINFPSGNAEVIENVSVINTGGPKLIDNYIGPINSLNGVSQLDAGLRRYRVYAYVSSNVGTTQLNFTKFVRHADGSETNIYTALSGDIDALTVTEYDFNHVMIADLPLNSTDRIGIRVSANTTHSAPISVYWVYQGTTHTSMLDSGFFVCPNIGAGSNTIIIQKTPTSQTTPIVAIISGIVIIGLISLERKKK